MKIITNYLAKYLNLDDEQEKVIYYGLYVVVTNLLSIITVLFIGYLFNELFNTFLLQLLYAPLRLFIGGYHSKTPKGCFIIYNLIFLVFIIIMSNINYSLIFDIITIIGLMKMLYDNKDKHLVLIIIHLLFILITYNLNIHYIYLLAIDINLILYALKDIN